MAAGTPHTSTTEREWPGKKLGLPESGPRSIGRLGRRLAAIAIDWALALLVSAVVFGYDLGAPTTDANVWLTPGVFVLMQIIMIPLTSGSIGHLIVGLRVVPLTGGWVGVWRPAVRTILLSLLIPAVIWDRDQRGFHDKAAGTVLVRS
jgi:uncharacterized RDD family membrane protein YckC